MRAIRGMTFIAGMALLCMSSAAAMAAECQPTPATATAGNFAPDDQAIPRSNNLARPSGKSIVATGQPVRLQVRVLDRNCKPVVGAAVELWQANRDGLYQVADRAALANPYAVFAGAGRASTDNAGIFNFYTIFPGGTLDQGVERAPRLHVRLRQQGMKTLTTELYFDAERRNATDPVYSKLSSAQQQNLTLRIVPYARGELLAEATLVLDGTAPYVQY